jgi:CRISPR/Cas system-associated exonuclease Cas4 (RecB family)
MKLFEHNSDAPVLEQLTRSNVDGKRIYQTPSGEGYPSVTTVLGILGKEDLMAWRRRVGEEEANRISTQAARRGTAVHKLCEEYLNNNPDYSKKHMPANIQMFNAMKPILDEKINNIWYQECFLYSNELQTAGQVDCICEWNGELAVVDFKTSRKLKKEEWILNYYMQVSFYAKAFEEMTGTQINKGIVFIGVDNEDPQVFEFNPNDYIEHFKAVRETYKELYEKDKVHNF